MRNEEYIAEINKALLSFQMIEEGLKVCVGLSYEIISATAPYPIAYRFPKKSILNAPLGRLIQMFSQVTVNEELIKDLKKVIEWRNFCTHNAFTHEFLGRVTKSPFKLYPVDDVRVVVQYTTELVQRLGKEIESIQAIYIDTVGNNNDQSKNNNT